jgi:hypothetical protein
MGMGDVEIRTIWHTRSEQCELVLGYFTGCHLRLWVQGRLIVDELMADVEEGVRRAWELRTEWPQLVD